MSGADEGSPAGEDAAELSAPDVEAVVLATRLLVAISAQSVAAVDDVVTLPQLRVLVMVSSRGPLNLGAVAAGLGVHPSNATRAVDRMVGAGLLSRSDDPTDRRNLVLELTPAGQALVDQVMTEHPVNPILDSYYSRIVCMFAINIPLPRLRTWPGCSAARPGTPSAYDLQCLLCRIQLFELGSRNRRLARAAKVEVQP